MQQPPPCTPERFKELCLRLSGCEISTCKEILALMNYFFSPETFLDNHLAIVPLIKKYLAGGSNFELFKSKGILQIKLILLI